MNNTTPKTQKAARLNTRKSRVRFRAINSVTYGTPDMVSLNPGLSNRRWIASALRIVSSPVRSLRETKM